MCYHDEISLNPAPAAHRAFVSTTSAHKSIDKTRNIKDYRSDKMASATGIPAHNPEAEDGAGESQPLLGQPGDVLQKPDESIFRNLVSGT